jgi:hypothetical protein
MKILQQGGSIMQNLILLILGAIFVYLLFSRKGGMGMGCCGGHASYGDHSSHDSNDSHCGHTNAPYNDKNPDEQSVDTKEDVIDLREDQYTVVTVEENKHPKTMNRTAS